MTPHARCDDGLTRRRFLTLATAGAVGCGRASAGEDERSAREGRLGARPKSEPAAARAPAGEHELALGGARDGLLYIPRTLPQDARAPLLVLLHGATGSARGVTARLSAFALADRFRLVVLAPDSRAGTWDVIRGRRFGPDVTFLDAALRHTFARVPIDPARVAVGGFSDGASYALSLGLINGDLFTHVLAFSPGFLVAERTHGQPAIYVSHGRSDEILPIDATSRRLVPALEHAGYKVRYHEFDGPHTVPAPIAEEALAWMNGARAAAGV